jgi:hypothetical protein
MKTTLILGLLCLTTFLRAQPKANNAATGNIRLSLLVFPPVSPLLTLELRTFKKLTIQLETNFINTHGINLKYFASERMSKHFIFIGTAFIENNFLRKDKMIAYLPYAGYGYAHRFGKANTWIFDSRIGVGKTINADNNAIYPVLKTGIGRTF